MPVKLTRRDIWKLAVTGVVIIVSLLIARRYFSRAFPEASIRFELSRGQAAQAGRRFLREQGLNPAGYRQATQFRYDDSAKTFLEREAGLAQAEKLLAGPLHLWRWQTRWFRPLSAEELRVAVTPAGKLAGFRHVLPNDAAGARLPPAAARRLAEAFLRRFLQLHPKELKFIGMLRQRRPRRTDTTFTWAARWPLAPGSRNADLQRASYRYEVTVAGDVVSRYREYLKIPQGWERRYQRLRSRNDTTALIADVFLLMLIAALLAVLVERLRRGDVHWRPALWIAAAGGTLTFLAQLNALPSAIFKYDTTQSWAVFLLLQVLSAALAGLGVGAFLALLAAGAEPLYRQRFPAQLFTGAYLTRRGFRTKSFFWSVTLGLALACFFFAYQTVFYLIANHFGAWAPADVPYSSLLNTRYPWVFIMLIGFWPAIFEEFTFRMLAIPLLGRWFGEWRPGRIPAERSPWRRGRLWAAVVCAAFIWGFAHANYPNQPFYIRGLEVGLGGVLLGWIMIRFGILTTVVWHYTVDAVYTAMLLLRAHNAYLRISGGVSALMAVLPLLVAAFAYWRRGGFEPEEGLRNADLGVAPPLPASPARPAEAPPAYSPILRKRWAWGAGIALLALTGWLLPKRPWPQTRYRATPAAAAARARSFLQQQGFSLDGYRVNVITAPAWSRRQRQWDAALNAIYQRHGLAAAQAAAARWGPELGWQTRFFKPLDAEQFWVWTDPAAARIAGYRHEVRDAAPGAALAPGPAEANIQAWLAGQGIQLEGMPLIRQQAKQRAARRDYNFGWQATPPAIAPAEARVTARLQGSQPGGFSSYLRLPQAEMRRREAWTAPRLLALALKILAGMLLAAWLIWLLYRAARGQGWPGTRARTEGTRRSRSRPLLMAAAASAGLILLASLDGVNSMLAQYPTALPWAAWLATIGISLLVIAGAIYFLTVIALAPLAVAAPQAQAVLRRSGWRSWGRDAAAASLLGLGWLAGWTSWLAWLERRFHAWSSVMPPSAPRVDAWIPGLSSLLAAPVYCVWLGAVAGTLAASLHWLWGRGRRGLACAALALAWGAIWPQAETWRGLAFGAITAAISLALVAMLAAYFLRGNCLAYFSLALSAMWLAAGWNFWQQPPARYRLAGGLLMAAAAWLLALWIIGSRRHPQAEPA